MITTVASAEETEASRPYQPHGVALDLMYYKGSEVLLSGPAGTGKTRANLEKLLLIAEKYAGCRILICRKTRASLTDSVLVTWEKKVVPEGHPCLKGPTRKFRNSYLFRNGSEIVVGGLDEPTRSFSTEYDIIYVAEATELTLEDWESLLRALRNGKVPYQQIISDCNPDSPQHWLYQRCQSGVVKMLESKHEDNPELFDPETGAYTEFGKTYLRNLDNLTGPRKLRLRHGRWVQAEGVVYEHWDAAKHRITRKELPPGWQDYPRYWDIDFGYTNPFSLQEWLLGPDGDLYRFRQIYRTKRLVSEHAADMLAALGYKMKFDREGEPTGDLIATRKNPDPLPRAVICDHDAEGRATFERHTGLRTTAAYKAIEDGIQATQERLGRPESETETFLPCRLWFVRDGLIHPPDENLMQGKLPTCTEEEMDAYVWDTTGERRGKKKGELPVDKNNHGLDGTRYQVAFQDQIWKRSNQVLDLMPL